MKLRWSVLARGDLRDVKEYIQVENPRAAAVTVALIRRSADRLRDFPRAGRALDVGELRVLGVPGTPYRLIYRLEGQVVLILGVWHGARKWPFG